MLREHDDIMDDYEDRLLRLARLAPVESGVGTVSRQRKLSGQFKMSTRLGVGQQDLSLTFAVPYRPNFFRNEEEIQRQNFTRAAQRIQLGTKSFITNNQDYGPHLEFELGDLAFTRGAANWQSDVDTSVRRIRNGG